MINLLLKLWEFLKWPTIAILAVICFFWILTLIYLLFEIKRTGNKPKKPLHSHRPVKVSVFKRLFYQFPRMMALDIINRNPDAFKYQGIIIYEGDQGDGKSSSMMEHTLRMQKEYPLVKCIGNLKYDYADDKLTSWEQLIDYKNGELGVIVNIDELQNWFSCKDSQNFPPEMLAIVTQNRKNRRIILGTAQRFYMLAKDIRTQCTEVRSCKTFFKCVTVVVRKKPFCDSKGDVIKWRFLGLYWYVHTPELRDCYDTYEVIERLAKSGFIPKNERYNRNDFETATSDLMARFMEG